MAWWIYKCNSSSRDYQHSVGDWAEFWDHPDQEWGTLRVVPALAQLTKGDMVLAYQTDRNELYGLAQVRQACDIDGYLYLDPIVLINIKVRPLKKADPRIASIPALRPGPIQTVYAITETDAKRLLMAAGSGIVFDTDASEDDVVERGFLEGEKRAATTTTRNAKLRKAAKKLWGVKCYCCGFDSEQFYGDFAHGAAIVHHLKPFPGSKSESRLTTTDEVRVVCANCHYVMHLQDPPLDVDELKRIVSESWSAWSKNGIGRKR